jgi:hypothetical protein
MANKNELFRLITSGILLICLALSSAKCEKKILKDLEELLLQYGNSKANVPDDDSRI